MEELNRKQLKQLKDFSELALSMLLVMRAFQSVNGKLKDTKLPKQTLFLIFLNPILLFLTFVNKHNGRRMELLKEPFEYSFPIYSNM